MVWVEGRLAVLLCFCGMETEARNGWMEEVLLVSGCLRFLRLTFGYPPCPSYTLYSPYASLLPPFPHSPARIPPPPFSIIPPPKTCRANASIVFARCVSCFLPPSSGLSVMKLVLFKPRAARQRIVVQASTTPPHSARPRSPSLLSTSSENVANHTSTPSIHLPRCTLIPFSLHPTVNLSQAGPRGFAGSHSARSPLVQSRLEARASIVLLVER